MAWDAQRGAMLVRTNGRYQPQSQVDATDIVAWLRENRIELDRHGYCPGGCNKQLVPHEVHGYAVCPMTYLPCESRRLSLLIKHLGIVNGKRDSTT